jgi:hypothetical protein
MQESAYDVPSAFSYLDDFSYDRMKAQSDLAEEMSQVSMSTATGLE